MNTLTLNNTAQSTTQSVEVSSQAQAMNAAMISQNESIKPTPHTNSLGVADELARLGEVLGEFKSYDSQLPIAEIAGTRVIKCLYQIDKKTGKKPVENCYVRVPTKHLTEEHIVSRIVELSPFILAWMQDLEGKAIVADRRKGSLQVFTEYLSMDKLVEQLEASLESSRLNKDKIEAWFTDKIEGELAELFGAKMGISEVSSEHELGKLEAVLNAYKAKFASLASPKSYLKEEDCQAMIKVIASIPDARESILGIRFTAKLGEMNKKVDDLLLVL
jgi:hypothetical protein